MSTFGLTETCLEYFRGEVLLIRNRSPKSDISGSRVEIGEVIDSVPLEPVPTDPAGRQYLALERVAVPIGLELRYLRLFARQPDVVAESLNYVGQACSTASAITNVTRSSRWMKAESDGTFDVSPNPPKTSVAHPLLLSIDVGEKHCLKVLSAAVCAGKAYTSRFTTLGVFPEFVEDTIFGLFDYMSLFHDILNLEQCPDAIVMSVDFGLACFNKKKKDL
jgi:hypothetical protein